MNLTETSLFEENELGQGLQEEVLSETKENSPKEAAEQNQAEEPGDNANKTESETPDVAEEAEEAETVEKKKRHRRTKSEILAAREAERDNMKQWPIHKQLFFLQQNIHCYKDNKNTEAGFPYRTCEDIMACVKPLLAKCGCTIITTSEILPTSSGNYIIAYAVLQNERGEKIVTNGHAREDAVLPNMCAAQITGACESYARKYALGALLAFDTIRLKQPVELDELKGSEIESTKKTAVAEIVPESPIVPRQAMQKKVLRQGTQDFNKEVMNLVEWTGTKEEFVRKLDENWDYNEDTFAILMDRRSAPFAQK